MGERVMVSACLLGVACRHDGRSAEAPLHFNSGDTVIPICPEVVAGFGTPRPAIEHTDDGRIHVVETGADVTLPLARACDELAERARKWLVTRAVLKDKSPSCGTRRVWKCGRLVAGSGLMAQRLHALGIVAESESE
jgi:uncharacterized protein YbbK (DUF523 family)